MTYVVVAARVGGVVVKQRTGGHARRFYRPTDEGAATPACKAEAAYKVILPDESIQFVRACPSLVVLLELTGRGDGRVHAARAPPRRCQTPSHAQRRRPILSSG